MNKQEIRKEIKDRLNQEHIDKKEFFHVGVWWKSEAEFNRIISLEFKKLDKKADDYGRQLETMRQFYSIRKHDLFKYIS